jgi:flagellar biosynthesis protein FlhF
VANPRRWRKEAPTRLLHLKEELESRIRTDEPWATEEGLLRPLAFVGPSGSGKTTLAVKLAAKWDVEYGITPLLIAADASKPGAACRLQRLSGIQGLPCEAIDSPQQLVRAVESGLAHGPVFVDTLALRGTGRNQEDWSDVLRAVRAHVLLVMPATLKPADMSRTVTLYQDLKPCAIAFTHLDETSTFGSCVGEALSTRLPIAYLSHGAEIPRDFTVAEPGSVVSCLFSSIQQIHSAPVGH